MNAVQISGRTVGPGHSCFIIAEAGVNHNGSLETAKHLIDVACRSGADAVKFQTFRASELATPEAPKAKYQLLTTAPSESQFEMLRALELSPDAHRQLQSYCQDQGLLFMSTPFDEISADLLAELDVPVFKIASGEITNLPLIEHIAKKGKPIILSTGMSSLSEVDQAIQVIRDSGCDKLIVLQCVSNYPASPADVNLRAMQTMAQAFQVPVGYSDHTLGIEVALAAVALGACVIEKHCTLDNGLPGPDHRASLEPREFSAMVRGIRTVEAAMGHGRKEPAAPEAETASVARKSLVAAGNIAANTVLKEEMIAIKRPGSGLPPAFRPFLVGRTALQDIRSGTLLTLDLLG